MKKTHSREVGHEEKLRVYAKNRFLNKIVYGADRRLMEDENVNLQMDVHASLDNCFLLVTGIKRKLFDLTPGGQYNYFDRSPFMSDSVYEILDEGGYEGDYTYMDPTQEICILFSPKKEADGKTVCPADPEQTAGQIQDCLHQILREKLPEERMCCYTVFGGHVGAYEDVAVKFRRATALQDLSFFDMRPMVMTEELLAAERVPCSFHEASEMLKILEHMLESGDSDEKKLEELFLVKLKKSFDFSLVDDILAELKRMFWEIHRSYDMEGEFPWKAFERDSYARLEEAYEQVRELWRIFHSRIRASSCCMSYVTRNAVLYIKNHYTRPITARDVADFVHVSPSHLSHTFNREMKQSIPSFLVACRLRESKRLLQETDLRIGEVASRVGIDNVSYFLKLFKQYEGMTPQEYRCSANKAEIAAK